MPIQDRDADIDNDTTTDESTPLSPANASGIDKVGMDEIERESIDEESMYDNRRDEDKDDKPSTRL